ncbi:MAG TPA: catalase [Burkholderiaceae bacterium]|nr:catalase [Burkholderiaceae bacterium]
MKDSVHASTAWQERIEPDEAERFASYARRFAALQQRASKRHGPGRALHRKQITAARGVLDVLDGLPDFARHGLFARPARYETVVRLSNGAPRHQPDRVPDIRGFALRVAGVQGASALGHGPAASQDFLLIHLDRFAFARPGPFVDFVEAAAQGKGALVRHLIAAHGLLGGLHRLGQMLKSVGRPFSGFATEALHSTVPIACGPYAVRVRMVPGPGNGPAAAGASQDWAADFARLLRERPLAWELQLQPFVSETRTPIEDASVAWDTPFTTVARLTLEPQDTQSAQGQALAREAEAGVFDVWHALADHRPLGEVQRARKVLYFASQQSRGAA